MDAALLTPSKYIKAVSFQGKDRTVTITGVKIEELEREDNTKEMRGLISMAETQKRWVLNVTNVKSLVALFGRETDNWLGKKVTLYPEPNEMSESGFAIRVRGSPELEKDVAFTLKLARKKARRVVLKATGKNANGKGTSAEPDPAPQHDLDTDVGDAFEDPPEDTETIDPTAPPKK
jgi:hypothetical protein